MQLSIVFAVLLACILHSTPSDAIPARAHHQRLARANPRTITMPLKRLHVPRTDVHPQLLLQQHINRGNKRLARMTGRSEPAEHELRAEMHKRMYLLESGSVNPSSATTATGSNFSRRYWRNSKHVAQAASNTSSTSTDGGVSALDIQAAENGGLTPAKIPTANNTLGLAIDADDVGYIATIQIGTPPQNFNILMDSGSADFWVGSETCQSQQGTCGNHTFLGSKSSSSFVQSNQNFNVTYGSGSVAGVLCQDNVNMAGLQLNKHTFGVANEESVQFSADTVPFDGLMGLAQSTLSNEKVPTPVESLASNGLISSAISSFKISRLADQLNDGQVTFGGLDSTKFVANTLVTIPNVSKIGFWEGAMDAITVNGQDTGMTGRTAILDTGTTLIIAPPADALAVIAMLGGKCDTQQCTISCTSNTSVALSFGNASFTIDPRDMAVLPVDVNDPTGDCTAGIQPGTIGTNTEWLVGDVFLKNAYFSVDTQNNKISLAKLS
ncbi:acid protease [Suillus discolor]|uniref:Acid protease n=1 Tax=Suillus discolor TaxID=1912936 RepID=A0A9P7F906_9AGAM|nr:acid protease [Suillus discolor]KAG2110967.1 acid protease [Suillus discolor]